MNGFHRAHVACLLVAVAGCSTVQFQGHGQYTDANQQSRAILLQWEAQKYYIPFIEADIDYGSVSLQAECIPDALLDRRNDEEHGLVFVERTQDFQTVPGAPDIRIGNYLVCAKLKDGQALEQLGQSDNVDLLVYCESKFGLETLPTNLEGYSLEISEVQEEATLLCPSTN